MDWQGLDVQAGWALDFLATCAQRKNRPVLCIPLCCRDERLGLVYLFGPEPMCC